MNNTAGQSIEVSSSLYQEVVSRNSYSQRKCGIIRLIVSIICSFGIIILMTIRVNISMVIVSMIDNMNSNLNSTENAKTINSNTRGIILSMFYLGYMISHFIMGIVSAQKRSHVLVGFSICTSSVFHLLTPLLLHWGQFRFLTIIILINGLCAGPTLPAFQVILGRWTPISELRKIMLVSFSGINIGIIYCFATSGIVIQYLGIDYTFYIFGSAGILWLLLWQFFIRNEPEENFFIRLEELTLILNERGQQNLTSYSNSCEKMMKSCAVWALVITRFTYSWVFYTFLTQLPTIFMDTLQYDAQTTGLLCALAFLLHLILANLCNRLSDYLIEEEWLSRKIVRKSANLIGFMSQAILLFLATEIDDERFITAAIIISIGLGGISVTSFSANHLEIAPKYSSALTGYTVTIASFAGCISTLLVGSMVLENGLGEWKKVLQLCSSMHLAGAVSFLLLGSTDVQSWSQSLNDVD